MKKNHLKKYIFFLLSISIYYQAYYIRCPSCCVADGVQAMGMYGDGSSGGKEEAGIALIPTQEIRAHMIELENLDDINYLKQKEIKEKLKAKQDKEKAKLKKAKSVSYNYLKFIIYYKYFSIIY